MPYSNITFNITTGRAFKVDDFVKVAANSNNYITGRVVSYNPATGDLVVTGNLTTSGTRTYANTTNVQLGDNIITLNAEIPSGLAPTENAGFEVNRGSSANVSLLWNETNDNWTATNDGSYFYVLADAAVDATQNSWLPVKNDSFPTFLGRTFVISATRKYYCNTKGMEN